MRRFALVTELLDEFKLLNFTILGGKVTETLHMRKNSTLFLNFIRFEHRQLMRAYFIHLSDKQSINVIRKNRF